MDSKNKTENTTNKQPSKPFKPLIGNFNWVYAVLLATILFVLFSNNYPGGIQISWITFKNEMLLKHDVKKIQIVNHEIVEVFIKPESLKKKEYKTVATNNRFFTNSGPHYFFTIGSIDFFEQQLKEAQVNFKDEEKVDEVYTKKDDWWSNILSWIFPLTLLVLLWSFWKRSGLFGRQSGGSIFDFGKSAAQEYDDAKQSQITFKDIAGYDEAKVEIMEIVDFLKNPTRFTKLGAKIPRGILLLGPPGTGKTHMAKAVAGEAGVPFFSLSGSEFVELFVGVGAARVRDLFLKAKQKAPSIVFIDEIDAIGRIRGAAVSLQSNDERESTLNQLLAEMDGFDEHTNVIVIAATNRPDILDSALLRPGRFDRHIILELPNKNEREAIFKVHMKPLKLDKSIDINYIVSQTPGFSGAEIANTCNEAALIAARNKKESVSQNDFMEAIDRIVGGLEKKSKIVSPAEKKVIAYHEAGHAVVSWMLKCTDPLVKVSIIPRGQSLGASHYLPEERQIYTYSQLTDFMCANLGGRAAEEIVFKETSSGALDDLEKVTKQAYTMVVDLGMSEKIGSVSFYDSEEVYQEFQKPFSEATAQMIDAEVRRLTGDAYEQAKQILIKHLNKLHQVSKALLEKEIIYKEELEVLLGKRPQPEVKKQIADKVHTTE